MKGSGARLTGTVLMTGSRIQDELFAPGSSSRAKYAALVVGRTGLGALVRHEVVVMLSQGRAGASE